MFLMGTGEMWTKLQNRQSNSQSDNLHRPIHFSLDFMMHILHLETLTLDLLIESSGVNRGGPDANLFRIILGWLLIKKYVKTVAQLHI
ncbi:hypothetical protein C486_05759 [Natrinema gari JCM 14663]|uniref:Uncharacterized protein n=1 Tax=Natrinema gari JCM 14663 TaxID=1230459 RepID=L9ZAG2_9EURY|nr:hypothetical protein C486_05759 [Natrinema gari JCM 14663]